jgi:N-acetylglucosamine kinase-like BadF-type ATPase
MSFYLALDAGGTKTDYALADETREIARVRTGTIKRMRTDDLTATRNLDAALAELTARTGVSMKSIERTCVGTAGEAVPMVTDWLRAAFAARVSGELLLLGDVEIALDAAFPGMPGVLAMAGTGSNVAGRSPSGKLVRGGGWGPALADQGSGNRIGLNALRAIFLAIDESGDEAGRAAPTQLLPAVLEFWKLGSLSHLIEYANAVPSPDFSALTGLVLGCAEAGDATARAVLRSEGESLAYLVRLVARQLRRLSGDPGWTPPLAFTGSVLEKVAPVRESLMASMRSEFPEIETPSGVIDPVAGAIWRARNG